jgi:hypothetical protein
LTSGKRKRAPKGDMEKPETAVADDSERPENVQYTFLDTINRGNELVLTNEDFDKAGGQQVAQLTSDTQGDETRYRVQVFASNKIETIREQKKLLEK